MYLVHIESFLVFFKVHVKDGGPPNAYHSQFFFGKLRSRSRSRTGKGYRKATPSLLAIKWQILERKTIFVAIQLVVFRFFLSIFSQVSELSKIQDLETKWDNNTVLFTIPLVSKTRIPFSFSHIICI